MKFADVLIPLAPQTYTYRCANAQAKIGDFVQVSFGARRVVGVVWALHNREPDLPPAKIKSIEAHLPYPPLEKQMRDFIEWVAHYVMSEPSRILKQVMSAPQVFTPRAQPKKTMVRLNQNADLKEIRLTLRLTPARTRILEALQQSPLLEITDLAAAADTSPAVIKAFHKAPYKAPHKAPYKESVLEIQTITPSNNEIQNESRLVDYDSDHHEVILSPEQAGVAKDLCAGVAAQSFGVHLLDGVTGSGKTEVYFEAIATALKHQRNVLILLPEISLTAQFQARFQARFGAPPLEWHSGISPARRRDIWAAVSHNRVAVVAGARSALFLPWRDLGLIIIDEEHDGGFKQEEGVIYNARDMAVVRARFAACPIILSSATPSLESYVNGEQKRYQTHRLTHRHGTARLPKVELVDMRLTPPAAAPKGAKGAKGAKGGRQWLAPPLHHEVAARLEAGEQSLLFLNRRGYAPLILCRACGHRYQCEDCDSWLVAHQYGTIETALAQMKLTCHHCGRVRSVPPLCEACETPDQYAACGPGVERIREEIETHYPQARVMILSSDHSGGIASLRAQIKAISDGEIDIIIGTQIVAKGHHFPNLSFVGVVDADLGLGNGDLRAGERTYQILSQVAGRSGREHTDGHALLQTYMPEHPVLQALSQGDRDAFFAREANMRRAAKMPPFGKLAALIISAPSHNEGWSFCRALAACAPTHAKVRVLGPTPAPIARLRGRYRFRFLVKSEVSVQSYIKFWLAAQPRPSAIRLAIDIDPYRFF
ncbi:MAG: primosomal protein N' [Alphaproteobacteria bacterium]|nr:primosomal protein N' [Alphaproteobacteria bacterium]